jgi:DNA-directed RNA polymerase subunit RPC12/RpoP
VGVLEDAEMKKNGGYICAKCSSTFIKPQICKSPKDKSGIMSGIMTILIILFVPVIGLVIWYVIWLLIDARSDKTPEFIPCPKCGARNSYLLITPEELLFIKEDDLDIK